MRTRHILSEPERAFLIDALAVGVVSCSNFLVSSSQSTPRDLTAVYCSSSGLSKSFLSLMDEACAAHWVQQGALLLKSILLVLIENFRIDCSISIEPTAARTIGRPTSGFLYFDVRKTVTARQMSALKTQGPQRELDRVQPVLNRLYRDAKAIELDSLCIEAYHCVYKVRVQVNIVQEDGNLVDCAAAVVAAALGVVKRRAVEYDPNSGLLRFVRFFYSLWNFANRIFQLSREESVASNIPMSFFALTSTYCFLGDE